MNENERRWQKTRYGRWGTPDPDPPAAPRPPKRWRSSDLKALPPRVARSLAAALESLPDRNAPWPESVPEDWEAWWQAVLNDPRARRSTTDHIPARSQHAYLRLDRQRAAEITFTCVRCAASGTFRTAELRKTFGADRNVNVIGVSLVPCPRKRTRRDEYECAFRFGPGDPDAVRRVPGVE